MHYEERTVIRVVVRDNREGEMTFRFGVSTDAEFLLGNVLMRVVEESTPGTARKLIVRFPEDEAEPVLRAAGGALLVHDLVASGAWADLARPVAPGGGIPIADIAVVRPYLDRLRPRD